eukprot:14080919-Alexandrium_andersonii.AAC.1
MRRQTTSRPPKRLLSQPGAPYRQFQALLGQLRQRWRAPNERPKQPAAGCRMPFQAFGASSVVRRFSRVVLSTISA